MEKEQIAQLIFNAIDEVNQLLPEQERLVKSIDTVLFGNKGKLDSLGLVSLIVAIEQKIEEALEIPITLADERALSQKRSPFRTIGTLADYIDMLLRENQIPV